MSSDIFVRLALRFRGDLRKFAWIVVGPDNSFYIRLQRPVGEPWTIPAQIRTGEPGRFQIDFENPITPAFDQLKTSYHFSGVVHATGRLNEKRTIVSSGVPFDKRALPSQLCALVPCRPDRLPICIPNRRENHIVLELGPDQRAFTMGLSLVASGYSAPSQTMLLHFPERPFSLLAWLKQVPDVKTGASAEWPPYPFTLVVHSKTTS